MILQEGKETDAMILLEKARAAAPLLEKAASLNPGESAVFYHLARALRLSGEMQRRARHGREWPN